MAEELAIEENITYRISNEEDITTILEFRELIFKESGVPDSFYIQNMREKLRKFYFQEYEADRMRHFIALNNNNEPIAVIGSLIKNDFPYFLFDPGFYGWIIDVYTLPSYRGKGIATHLLELNHQWLGNKGVRDIKLLAFSAEAKRVYEKVGYKVTNIMSFSQAENNNLDEIIKGR